VQFAAMMNKKQNDSDPGENTPLLNESLSDGSFNNSNDQLHFKKNANPQVLEVRDLSYEVDIYPDWRQRVRTMDPRGKKYVTKVILKDITVTARPGKLLAILGSSGSGKTTLLDVLASRTNGGRVSGEVLLNSKPTSHQLIKSIGAYVTQEDRFLPNLTVKEVLTFVAHMKFPSSMSEKKKANRVNTVIAELGLRHLVDTIIGGESSKGISGGERRRLSIGCQLLLDPSILFLDEPTSGLDSFTAQYIVQTLISLARSDRTVITTIHSPRTDIFQLFDRVLLLSQGETVFFGDAQNMVEYFNRLGFSCPKYSNPCDYFMDIATIDFRSAEQTQKSTETVSFLIQKYRELTKQGSNLLRKPSIPVFNVKDVVAKPLNGIYQFQYLYLRASKNRLFGFHDILVEAFQSVAMGIIIGAIYWRIGNDQISITDRYGLFFILSSLFPFQVILNNIAAFNEERRSFYNERQDGLYDLLPYFFSKLLSDLPFDIFFALIYALPGYYMIQLNPDTEAFIMYLVIITLSIYTSRSIALATAAGITSFQTASFVGNLTFSLFLIPSGFLINLDTITPMLQWLSDISYLKFSFESLATNEFTGLNFTCDATLNPDAVKGYCIETGEQALFFYALNDVSLRNNIGYFLIVILVFKLLQYFLLRFVNQRPQ